MLFIPGMQDGTCAFVHMDNNLTWATSFWNAEVVNGEHDHDDKSDEC